MARGASFIEVHVAFHKGQFGPDISASITMDDLALLVQGAKALNLINRHPVDKDRMASDLIDTKKMFGKSLGTARELKKGTALRTALLKELKPGTGIPSKDLADVIGKKLRRDLGKNEILHWKDIS
jgi:N-acetylneuraminate synthase